MSKFCGIVGFSIQKKTGPGVWSDEIVEQKYYGDLLKNIRKNQNSSNVNDNITISNEVSIISDEFATNNYSSIVYVVLKGVKWKVTDINIQYPRLILSLGGVYNG